MRATGTGAPLEGALALRLRDLRSAEDLARRPTSAITEASLLHGYSRVNAGPTIVVLEQRDCRCGGQITANPEAPADGVALHNESPEHETWLARLEEERRW